MIRHVVLFSAKDPAYLPAIKEGLEILAGIPGAHNFEVCYNTKRDTLSREMDVVVYCEFDSLEDLDAYKQHPLYEESIRRVRPLRDQRVAADFESTYATCPA
ncbi:Dabb family protein [Haematospirillum jordaniae]|uniref:Stress responsive protein n=1 Tax=Haematospirillum jordaniae TaxID=1549855 RepID=A0A143DBV5_9PROT|nr:Dabb family protein [Haematospirillum jordaniae]AMW34010.1 stress responsive protein [Haematospirillum jordaniae]NKD57355.1 Dabb family protein [Haematospirillum jordaniae]NKD59947.1 Dabb family protein [Haematospirillum jordaniae]NKD67814.1 Dabb family protein [Haematospirillum jordaniae]NKD79978.1 Dabb family protein [Haematospirillum jordaniae]